MGKLTARSQSGTLLRTSITHAVNDPSGTPVSSKETYDDIGKSGALAGMLVRYDITGLTGGTATDLDSIVTLTVLPVAVTTCHIIHATDGYQVWHLIAGTSAETEAGGIIRPDDYAASTNEKIWVQVL